MLNFTSLRNDPDLMSTLKSFEGSLKYNIINCCRIGLVDSYNKETRVAKVLIANKLTTGQDDNGVPITQNYAPIYAKVLFFGWKDIEITHPVIEGSEGILLFNDREIESWYINGNVNNLAYDRAHDKTDAIFISGLLSLPNMVATLQDCLNLKYNTKNMQISENNSTINGDTIINGNLTVNGKITATGDIVSGSISLQNHVHGNGNMGENTTSPI